MDDVPYARSSENRVPCGFSSDDDDDETDLEEDDDVDVNRCVECGIDMGVHNPRQYCGKTHCLYGRGNGWTTRQYGL